MFSKRLGSVIRRLRIGQGMSQRDLAQKARVTPGYIAQLEASAKEPSPKVLQRLARALGVPAAELKRGEDREMKIVTVKLKESAKEILFTDVARIENKPHRLELYGPELSDPLAEFDKADVATWYSRPQD